jgi:hypothetical protein
MALTSEKKGGIPSSAAICRHRFPEVQVAPFPNASTDSGEHSRHTSVIIHRARVGEACEPAAQALDYPGHATGRPELVERLGFRR